MISARRLRRTGPDQPDQRGGRPESAGAERPGPGGQARREQTAGADRVPPAPLALTHLDETGAARMVDVTTKEPTVRQARATALVTCAPAVVAALREGTVPKGDVLAVARVAGIAAAKRVPDLLPLAHVIGVHGAVVDLEIVEEGVRITAAVRTADRTGVEMEALTAATVAGLAVVDMVKGVDRRVELTRARVVAKSGGRSGDWRRDDGDHNDDGDDERA
ncbi:cyclic pyranopterin monophosphate synthase MoaC [Actinomyces bowdenii]|uniref:cyclic pyranopterin monophosphate synthase n=1 Tax=Actinomyces bowdenii TaxID=131109 RepID=A0A3P1V878_9ACTO|nr:cyclic pyranopterin monophosphate synthase MoaC [Actinomyces bowdenii]